MIVTLKWLADFVDLEGLSAQDVANRFIEIGFEVEEMINRAKGMERVKVGRITKLTRHPNADKLQICSISLGGGEAVQIITAATNVFEGALVPCALDGADLPNGLKIKSTMMRGEESCGMLCSGEELNIDDSVYPNALVDGIMILDESAKEGQAIAEFLGLDDVIFDLKVLANRPDCQSVVNLAKELSVGFGRDFKMPKAEIDFKKDLGKNLDISVETENCPVYLGCVVSNVEIKKSPKHIQQRLKAVGINPKNNIIDLTNYCLYEFGQPLHAFDYDKIANQKIIVRSAREKEKLVCLDDKEYILDENITVIADSKQAIGIAGIMGGKDFSINDETKNVVIESAVFDRVNIRRGARSLGIRTDASARFERGVETVSAKYGMIRILSLIEEFGIGKVGEIIQIGEINEVGNQIDLELSEIKSLLGIDIPVEDVKSILTALDIEVKQSGTVLSCCVPALRADLERPADLIEEIIRFYGFDKIKPTNCEGTQSISGGMSSFLQLEYDSVKYMLAVGAHQVRTYGFRSPVEYDKLLIEENSSLRNFIKIENPLSLDYSIMRTQMLGSLLEVLKLNENRKNDNEQYFEIGKVFVNDKDVKSEIPAEYKILAYLSSKAKDFYEVKAICEMLANKYGVNFGYRPSQISFMHPNICADIVIGNRVVGVIGKVHPQVIKNFEIKNDCYYFQINLNLLPIKKVKKVKALAKFPAAYRDLAVVVDKNILVGGLIDVIKKTGGEVLEAVELFDIYEGEQLDEGKKSVAFNLTFRKQDRTLTQEEVNDLFDKILANLDKNFGAKLR